MAIYESDQPVTLYQRDYAPAEMYADGKKVTGYITQELAGQAISVDGTYCDMLDLTLRGKHEQKQYQGHQMIDIEHPQVNTSNTAYGVSKEAVWFSTDANYAGLRYEVSVKPNTMYYLKMNMYSEAGDNAPHVAVSEYCGGTEVKTNTIIYNCSINDSFMTFVTQQETDTVILFFRNRVASSVCHFEKPILSTTMADFEPYVGGIPSPNSQYPQEIMPIEQENIYVRSINYCPPLKEWNMQNGAYLDDEGYISLPNETSRAFVRVPWKTDGYRLSVYAVTQKLTDDYSTFLLNTMYYDHDMVRISGNGNATEMTRTPSRCQMGFGGISNNSVYAAAIHDAAYVYVEFTRGTVYGTRPYRFKNVSIADISCTEENRRFLLGRMPQTLVQQYQLYGSDGVFDTLEPCVLVDGEWKCRVTRRWKKLIYNGTQEVRCDINHLTALNRPYNYVYDYSIVTKVKYGSIAYCDKAIYSTSISNAYDRSSIVTTSVVSIFIPNQAVEGNTVAEYYQRCREYLKSNPYTCLYQLATPSIEYYDPIMLYTNPGSTIIKGNTEMVARIKTVDHSTEVSQAVKTQAEMPEVEILETAELQTDPLP